MHWARATRVARASPLSLSPSLPSASPRFLLIGTRCPATTPPAVVSPSPPSGATVPAGSAFPGTLGSREAARIFTGAPVPHGADAIVIQEDTSREDDWVTVREGAPVGRYIRPEGLDFRTGDLGLAAGTVLSARDIGLAAAMNRPWLQVRRRPRIAILATGDEVVMPGDPIGSNQIVSSNGLALGALVESCGGITLQLGIAADNSASLQRLASGAAGADMLVTTGGASVGEHDLVR